MSVSWLGRWLAMLCVVLGVLQGCESVAPSPGGLTPERFFLEARMALKSEAGAGRGQLSWRQEGEAFRVTAFGPFGAGLVVLEGDAQGATLLREGTVQSASPDELLATWLQAPPPFAALPHWLLGRPAPALGPAGRRGADGFEQGGWRIGVRRGDDGLPSLLTLERGVTSLRLAIFTWEAPTP